jgi:alpha-glucosidase
MDVAGRLRRGWARARLMFHTLNDLGPRTTAQVISHTLRRRRKGVGEWAARAATGPEVQPGALREVVLDGHGARLAFEGAELEIAFLHEDVARLTWGPGDPVHPYAAQAPGDWVPPDVTGGESADGAWVLAAGSLEVHVGGDGSLEWHRRGGGRLRCELPPRRRGSTWEHRFLARAGERFCGLGEQAAGVDLRGGTFRLWNRDPGGAWGRGRTPLYLGIPVVVSVHRDGSLLSFFDNPASARVRFPAADDDDQTASIGFAGGALRQFLCVGELPDLLDRYSALTGRPALPPRWALGYHQSRWGYRNERHVGEVLDGYRRLGVPLSAVHLDIDYMDHYRVFTVDRRRFPDLGTLARRAEEQAVKVVTIVDPGVKEDPGYPVYRQGVDGRRFCTTPEGAPVIGVVWPGRAAFPDFTAPAARRWWSEQYQVLTDAGVGGIWHDMNEPTSISLVGDPTLPLDTRHDLEGRGGDHAAAHNLYGMLMNRAGYDGLRRARPDRRPFIVSRSGWAGTQRWAWNWTGDVETSWDGLRQQMATIVGLGLSGVPFSGPDIGGFTGVPDAELYLRWLQMSVLLPFCRTHSVVGSPPREPWRFREPARSAIVAWITFRYRLLPYLYSLAHEAARSGLPLARPLWWSSGPDPVVDAGQDDTFLLGDALVVAPATAPGQTTRQLDLPPGNWHRWWAADGGAVATGRTEAPCPLERIPVLARAGAIVPLDDGWAEPTGPCALVDDAAPDTAPAAASRSLAPSHAPRLPAFHCWPADGSASGHLDDDAGDGDGPARHDVLELSGALAGGTGILRWQRHGDYPPPERVRVVVHGLCAERALADGRPADVRGPVVECGPFSELRLEGLRPA